MKANTVNEKHANDDRTYSHTRTVLSLSPPPLAMRPFGSAQRESTKWLWPSSVAERSPRNWKQANDKQVSENTTYRNTPYFSDILYSEWILLLTGFLSQPTALGSMLVQHDHLPQYWQTHQHILRWDKTSILDIWQLATYQLPSFPRSWMILPIRIQTNI